MVLPDFSVDEVVFLPLFCDFRVAKLGGRQPHKVLTRSRLDVAHSSLFIISSIVVQSVSEIDSLQRDKMVHFVHMGPLGYRMVPVEAYTAVDYGFHRGSRG